MPARCGSALPKSVVVRQANSRVRVAGYQVSDAFPNFQGRHSTHRTRKQVGDDWIITADANMATTAPVAGRGFQWDYRRAAETAREYERMKVYWLEEPLPRYDFAQLAELNRSMNMILAGGEGNNGLHEFRTLLEQGCYDMVNLRC